MEVDSATERLTENACTDSAPLSVSVFLKPGKVDDCSNNQAVVLMSKQASHPAPLSLVTSTKGSNITATLENESVWSRFHSLGTEMILTKQGRRMFPCCRFKLSGLDPERKYNLVMDIMPLDDFTHKWSGKMWEPTAKGEPHVFGQVCVHPDSPALGQLWMESPVSFYKVKLTNNSADQEGSVFLHQMHRYQPRLHVVPEDPHSKEVVALDSPNVQVFTFPKTEFYAVTSYQNPQITQLKIDCNPFAMAFRKDSQSIRLLQDRLGLCCPSGQQTQLPAVDLARYCNERNRERSALKHGDSPGVKDHRKNPESPSFREGDGILMKMKNAASSHLNGVALCKEDMNSSENDKGQETVVKQPLATPALHERVAPLDIEPCVTTSIQVPPQTINGLVSPVSSAESLKVISEDAVNCQISYAHENSPMESAIPVQVSHSRGRRKLKVAAVSLPKQSLLYTNQVNRRNATAPFRRKPFRRAKKPKSKWWSNARHSKSSSVITPPDVSLRPDLEDVNGMLFVSFTKKEGLDIHVQNMKHIVASVSPVPETQNQPDTNEVEEVSLSVEKRISKLESTLLLHLKQQKYRQVIHPLLQEVGIKLCLLDPAVSIDLQYLGVSLPFPPPIHNSLDQMNPSSHGCFVDSAGSFVSRTGKTNDPTKIKGWRDKFNPTTAQSTPEGPKNISAFCSDLLDEYLENEAQQISDRAAVFSKSYSTPVSYQLPSKSSSYVVTLDSLLKNRCTPLNKVCSDHANNIQTRPSLKSPKEAVPFSSEGPHYNTFEGNGSGSNLASSLQGDQAISSASHGTKNRRGRPQLRWSCGVTPAKMQDMEKNAFFHGKVRTHITSERANFALSSLLTYKKSVKRTELSLHHLKELACSEDFCRLGCICDSLQRKIRGPIHCRRVQCMFDCYCFKHKVLLIHPPKEAEIQGTSRRALMAFSIADTEKDDRPPPASSITTLWKWRTEDDDPEPLFVPEPSPSLKVPRKHGYVPRPTPQIREEEKDPVYLYFESMMTCARVREYNSNPPPQVHMFPTRKVMQGAEKLNMCIEAGVPPTSERKAEKSTTNIPKYAPTAVKPEEPEPTKLLEILSECNWEPHRNLVLNALFWRISNNLFSEPFCLGVYKVQLLSTSLKRGENCSTVTYKVCVSRAEEQKVASDQLVKKPMKTGETQTKKGKGTVSEHMAPRKKSSPLINKQPEKPSCKNTSRISPLLTCALPAGYLKADKKNPGGPPLGLVKVNGKIYNQAKLLLGQMGALHPANRFAAFVTGRLEPRPQHQPKVLTDVSKYCLPQASVEPKAEPSAVPKETNAPKPTHSVSPKPHPARAPEPNTVSKMTKKSKLTSLCALSILSDQSTLLKEDASVISPVKPPGTTPIVSAGSKLHLPAPPSNLAVTPSAGVPGLNMCCLYNGQIIKIVPIAPGPIGQPQPSLNSEGSTPQVAQTDTNTCLPKDNKSVQKPLSTLSPTKTLLRPFPVTAPKILSLSGSSGMNIASGTPAFNLQSSFPGKKGTFSFRICPPSAEGKGIGSQPGAKPPDPLVAATPSTLVLPGGFTLIKLPLGSHSGLPPVPADTTTTSHPVEVPPKDEPMEKEFSQSCSHYTEQRCHASENNTSTHILETSNNSSTDAAGSSDGRSAMNSEGFDEGELKEEALDSVNANNETAGKYDWVPKGAEMVLKSDDSCKSEEDDMDDWPPKGAEQVLWTDEDSAVDEESEDFNEHNSNADASVRNPAGMTANNSKNAARTDITETDISDCPQTHRNGLPHEKDEHSEKSQASAEPKQQMQSKDKEQIHDDSFANASSCTLKNSEQDPCLNVSPIKVRKEPNNKPEETLSSSPCTIHKKVLLQEDCSSTPTYSEPHNDLTQKHMVASQSNIPKNSSPVITKTEATDNVTPDCKLSNHFDNTEQCLGSGNIFRGFIKIESNSDPLQAHTCFDLLAKEQGSVPENILPISHKQAASKNQTVVSNHLDNKQNLESNTSEVVINRKVCFNPGQADSLFSTSSKSSNFLQHDEDENDYIDIVGDVPCPLLEGQTPPISIVPVHLPSMASKKTDPKSSSLSLMHKSVSENNKLQCKFGKQLDNYSQTFRKAEHFLRKDDVPEEPKLEKRNRFQFQKSHQKLHVDEENNVSHMNLYDEDEDPGNVSDSDRSEDSMDENERNSSSDDEDSSTDSESSSNGETPSESANTSSEEDETVDIESFEENQEKLIVTKMKDQVTKYRKARQTKATKKEFRKKLNQSVDTFDRMESLSANKLVRRLTHTEKERMRRDEMRQSFASLKTALNIEEQIKICKHDILIQARLMIRALEDRNRTLEERKKALIQRQSTYVSTIAQLSGKTEEMVKTNFKEHYDQEKWLDIQNLVPASAASFKVNPQQLDREGNQLQPRLGSWKSKNHTRIRSKKTSGQSSTTPTGKRKKTGKHNFKEDCEEDKQLDIQNLIPVSSPQRNPRRLDSEGNQLPPRLGLWKSINYIRKRSKKSSRKPLVTPTAVAVESSDTCTSSPVSLDNQVTEPLPSFRTGDVILKLVAETSGSLPQIPKHLSADLGPPESNTVPELDQRALPLPSVPSSKTALSQKAARPFTLPKIILQSFGKTDTTEKLTSLEKSPIPSSPHASMSAENSLDVTLELQDKEMGTERVNSTKIYKETEKSSGSEESNQENPSSSSPVSESSIQSHNLHDLEKDKDTTVGLVKVRKRRAKSEVIKDASSDPDGLGPRMLRNRSPASNRMSTRSTPGKRRQRVFR